MSLMSRVRDIDDVPTLAASADDNALERLKEHIQRFVSTDDIAAIMAEQPSRARNELKSACRQAFEDASWAGVSQRVRFSRETPSATSCARSSIACWGRWGAASTRRRPW